MLSEGFSAQVKMVYKEDKEGGRRREGEGGGRQTEREREILKSWLQSGEQAGKVEGKS